ncbi:DUF6988 family protein [Vibrio parahaemolyticus]|uniref:DUF6988 family protein n=1 Tax=Vibrio parahaemolyticus TaxID=670 RepID=UPI0011238449|nr:DUF5677 domain-containing protein [Vibrio parahaemolyticus]TOP98656.1 hypothetical protein CGH05_20975 [Vibrio parahaemolyticus]HCE4999922.1 hypothetical protein [Vibrio parahaemolyticus]
MLDKSKELSNWIAVKVDDGEFICDGVNSISAALLNIAIEHHQSVIVLVERKLYSSAFALARSMFESTIRGLWINNCANEQDVDEMLSKDRFKNFGQLICELEAMNCYSSGVLSRTKKSVWALFNSFTHSGYQQISRQFSGNEIISNFSSDEVNSLLSHTGALALLATIEIASIMNNEPLMLACLDKVKEFSQ